MNTKLLSISLALITSVLVACGGGGDARSPDRPAPRLDPATLRIDFPVTHKLPGLGTNKVEEGIPVRLVALQTDGVEFNLGPELNVTDKATWSIEGAGNPPLAELNAPVRSAISFGKVKDILSATFYPEKTPAGAVNPEVELTVKALFKYNGRDYPVVGKFLVIPPKRVVNGQFVDGPALIAIDPLDSAATVTANYQLLHVLQNVTIRENRTGEAKFCAEYVDKGTRSSVDANAIFSFASYSPDQVNAVATIKNPFDSSNSDKPMGFIIKAIDPAKNCADLYDADATNDPNVFAEKTVSLQPAVVKGPIDVCTIVNPAAGVCNTNGELNTAVEPLTRCIGLDSPTAAITEVSVPAASQLQMVAKLHYENPANINQTFERYQCRAAGLMKWNGAPTKIFTLDTGSGTPTNTLSEPNGTATTISQSAYDQIRSNNSENNSVVTASYTNSNSTTPVTGNLKINLTDSAVSAITIYPLLPNNAIGTRDSNNMYSINLSILQTEKRFIARCTYASGEAPCGSGTVKWTVGDSSILSVSPANTSVTTAKPTTPNAPIFAATTLTATYKNTSTADTVVVDVVDDQLVKLVLMQIDESQNPVVDEFSCLGSGNVSLDPSQQSAEASTGSRRFKAHALFKSNEGAPNAGDPTDLTVYRDVTPFDAFVFSADIGYYDSANNSCVVTPQSGEIPVPVDEARTSPPARFSPTDRGLLEAQGAVRLSTMCVQVFTDRGTKDGVYTPPTADTPASEKETLSENGATVLVQPAGTAELADNGGSACALFDPLLSSDNPLAGPVLLPMLFELGYYADPLLSNLPSDEIVDGINSAEFPGGGGGGTPPPGLAEIQAIAEGLSPETLTAIAEACLVTQDDVTGFISSLTGAIEGGDPEAGQAAFQGLIDGAISPDDCTAAFPVGP